MSLRLGRNLDADNLRTGHDVYFECHVRANPPPLRLEWMRDVSPSLKPKMFSSNVSLGIPTFPGGFGRCRFVVRVVGVLEDKVLL